MTMPADDPPNLLHAPGRALRRGAFVVLVTATGALGSLLLAQALAGRIDVLAAAWMLVLFALTFTWIAVGFWTAVAGFVLQLTQRDPLSLQKLTLSWGALQASEASGAFVPADAQTAIVMPVFHEDIAQVSQRIETIWRSIHATQQHRLFHFFLLSDSQEPQIIEREMADVTALRERLPKECHLTYRRRDHNHGRKPGNIADFCSRWGAEYRYMVVLDADSLMSGPTLVELVRRMEANPRAGLLQTLPLPVHQRTVFGRLQQFAHALHSPMLAFGQSFWQTDVGNYWGHNAIIRMAAFREHCQLPVLSGEPPMGGPVLSHDFVEAALLRRAGWEVWMLPQLGGSFEEMPSNLIDYARRDRRWCQGNLQHLRLVALPGLHWMSRVHFLLGAMSYLASLAWFLLLFSATLMALGPDRGLAGADSGTVGGNWVFLPLLAMTGILLFLPRLFGIALAVGTTAVEYGGRFRVLGGGLLEVMASILIAPILMFFHSRFVLAVLLGKAVVWAAQVRESREVSWQEAIRHGAPLSMLALFWGAAILVLAPAWWYWLVPVLSGLLFAPLILRLSGDSGLGEKFTRTGWFAPPRELFAM
jgi:membrane glycosyltransferase